MQLTFAHGLLGNKSFPYEPETFTQGTLHAVREAANEIGVYFVAPTYQFTGIEDTAFPTISDMGTYFGGDYLSRFVDDENDLWVGSSVGAAVMLQSMFQQGHANDIIMFKPIYDVITAIEAQAKKAGAVPLLDKLRHDANAFLPIPVAATDVGGDQGIFRVRARHLEDSEALRFLSDPQMTVQRFADAVSPRINKMMIIVAENDALSPPALAQTFMQIAQPLVANPIEIRVIEGTHATDHSHYLVEQTKWAIQNGWGRPVR